MKNFPKRDRSQYLGMDPAMRNRHADSNPNQDATKIFLGTILAPMPEPAFSTTQVVVDMSLGGIFTNVAWPGPNVAAGPGGIRSPVSIGIHGFYDGPLPGQTVAVGFVGGQAQNGVVLQKYSMANTNNPIFESSHKLPLTRKLHSSFDVIQGNFLGSYIAIRGLFPLPAEIDIFSLSRIQITAAISCDIIAAGPATITASSIAVTSATTAAITATTSISVSAPLLQLGSPAAFEPVPKGASQLVELTKDMVAMQTLQASITSWVPVPLDGGAALKALLSVFSGLPMANYTPTLSAKVFTE